MHTDELSASHDHFESRGEGSGTEINSQSVFLAPRSRVLIVDDEKSIRTTLSAFLQAEGYEVETAEDVQRALELLKQKEFDVVVSDIILPRVSGIALLRQIREIAPYLHVVIMTGEPTVETAVEAVRAGACDYLTKPVRKPDILRSVRNAARIKALEDEKRRLALENVNYQKNLEQLVARRTRDLEDALTRVKETQQQMIRHERMNALAQMASGIAHDFNNVLMPITGFSDMLLEDQSLLEDRGETIHMLEMIRAACEDARHIVRRLRQIYKNEDAERRLVDIKEIVESVISMTTPKWKEEMSAKGVTIKIAIDFQDVPRINGNKSELREVFTNLIFNAIDAMPGGGIITFRIGCEGGSFVVLEVVDTGVGMDEKTLRHCMEPFFTTKGTQGTGLGLAIVYGIVERHGGSIEIESKPGAGTTIRMRLPVSAGTASAEDDFEDVPEPIAPLRVLVIDDEDRSRCMISRFLHDDGHNVIVAEDGQDGLDVLRQGGFDLVITDRAMPFMSGDEVAEKIMKDMPGTPIIMLTGFGDIMKDNGEMPPGVTLILAKPVTRGRLRSAMAKAIKG